MDLAPSRLYFDYLNQRVPFNKLISRLLIRQNVSKNTKNIAINMCCKLLLTTKFVLWMSFSIGLRGFNKYIWLPVGDTHWHFYYNKQREAVFHISETIKYM